MKPATLSRARPFFRAEEIIMRLGISTLLVAALATAGLVGCGDSDTGAGGAGGAGGSDTGTGGADTGTGGEDAGSGGGSGGGDVQECTVEIVEPDGACDAGCDGTLSSETADMCTFLCSADEPCPESDAGTYECITDGATALCAYTCAGGDACPNGYICDEATTVCLPD
jgi:hypothetical protein